MYNFLNNNNNNNTQIFIAYISMFVILLTVLQLQITPAILAGLLGYILTKDFIKKVSIKILFFRIKNEVVGIIVGVFSIFLLGCIGFAIINVLNGENITDLITTLSGTLNQSKQILPKAIADFIPDSLSSLKEFLIESFKSHISSFAIFGKNALHFLLLILIGWLIGILIACKKQKENFNLFSKTWCELWLKLSESFRYVVFAQLKVAAFNSFIIILFLYVICPIIGWNIPYAKTLVILTFICGLLPIIGNLISNSITFILALTVSLPAALAALIVLMVIHKLEYLIISRSLGAEIGSEIWELLIVLFAGEILFGTGGLVFAPILYAFIKKEATSGYLQVIITAENSNKSKCHGEKS